MEHYQFVICHALRSGLGCACSDIGTPIRKGTIMQFYCEKAVFGTLISLNLAMWVLIIMSIISWFEG